MCVYIKFCMCISSFPNTLLHKNVTEMILGSSQFISDIILIIWLRGCLPGFRIIIDSLFSFFLHIQSIISSCSLYYLKMCWIHLLFFGFDLVSLASIAPNMLFSVLDPLFLLSWSSDPYSFFWFQLKHYFLQAASPDLPEQLRFLILHSHNTVCLSFIEFFTVVNKFKKRTFCLCEFG